MEKFLHLSGMTYLFNVHLSCYSRVTLGKSLLSSEPQFVHLSNWCMSHPGGKPRVDDFVPCSVLQVYTSDWHLLNACSSLDSNSATHETPESVLTPLELWFLIYRMRVMMLIIMTLTPGLF